MHYACAPQRSRVPSLWRPCTGPGQPSEAHRRDPAIGICATSVAIHTYIYIYVYSIFIFILEYIYTYIYIYTHTHNLMLAAAVVLPL